MPDMPPASRGAGSGGARRRQKTIPQAFTEHTALIGECQADAPRSTSAGLQQHGATSHGRRPLWVLLALLVAGAAMMLVAGIKFVVTDFLCGPRLTGSEISMPEASSSSGGYLFVTFRGEQTDLTEQIYFGLSRDGHTWSALNGGGPILVSHLGERGVRDPYLLRSHDGKRFYLLATDLSMNRGWGGWLRAIFHGSRAIIVWESEDLVHWSPPRRAEIAPPEAGCTWAPEAVYDPSTGDYLVFWASMSGRRRGDLKFRIWAARTKDFWTFDKLFVYIEQPYGVIDTTIVQENGRFYRFTKNEDAKRIIMDSSASLSAPWEPVPGFTLSKLVGHEGPLAFQLAPPSGGRPGTWVLLLDYYSKKQGYQAFVTNDLASGQFFRTNAVSFPFPFRHGTVLPVSEEEFDRLSHAYVTTPPCIKDL